MRLRSVDSMAKAAGFKRVTFGDGNNLHKVAQSAGLEHTLANGGDAWIRLNTDGGYTLVHYSADAMAYGPPFSDGWVARRFDNRDKEIRGACAMSLPEALEAEPVEC